MEFHNSSKDFRGILFYYLRAFRLRGLSFICTVITYFNCLLKNIKIGRNCVFYGLPEIIRAVQSGISIGNNCTVRSDFSSNPIGVNRKCIITTLFRNASVTIGNDCGFTGTAISAAEKILIGNNVICGANVTITDYDWHPERIASQPKPVIIQDNVWLGLNVLVLKGVTIGKNSIIGANSVVVKSIPENVIAAGNPCRVIKEIK